MMVRIIDCPAQGPEVVQNPACFLSACIDRQDPEYARAEAELNRTGRWWTGGGAAPLIRLERLGYEPQGAWPKPVLEFDVLAFGRDLAFIAASERSLDGSLIATNLIGIPYAEGQ